MKKWEGAKSVSSSTIVVEDNKKMMSLGPRAIKQLTGSLSLDYDVINLFNLIRGAAAEVSNGPIYARR